MPHYNYKTTEKAEKFSLPVLPLRGIVAYPSIPMSFEVTTDAGVKSCERANKGDGKVFIVTQKELAAEAPEENELFRVGVVAKLKQSLKLPGGNLRVIIEGICRAAVLSYNISDGIYNADVMGKHVYMADDGGIKCEALIHEIETSIDTYIELMPKLSTDLALTVKSIKQPDVLSDFVACNIVTNIENKQKLLEEFDPMRRLELLTVIMERELDIIRTELDIHKKVRSQIDSSQREFFLREQLKVIQNELGCSHPELDGEGNEYYEKIVHMKLPEDVKGKLLKETRKLAKVPYSSPESSVIKTYLDTCLEIPWNKTTKDRIDIAAASKILEHDHDGLEKVKERILEFLAVKQLNPEIRNQIICLVGPPGTGKTSIAQSIARAMKRKYVRVSLGGVRDEADIRGHRKTYVGSMPGRIVNALIQAKTLNPLILLDEIDKLTRDAHGDPASALLEVLDGEQNKSFRDHFIELPIDLSGCIFIATANTLETVPTPLIDRMEVIELKIYTRHEKLSIAKNHLIPKQLKRHGLSKRTLKIEDSAIFEIIDLYTMEAGVRNLEREIANVCRKAAKILIESEAKNCIVTGNNVSEYLGRRKVKPEHISDTDEVGVVNGLAYTELGGDMLRIEVAVMPGSGKVELTGSLGEVMKESAHAAISYIRSHSEALEIDSDFYKTKDIHIHVPEGAVPKDGPSAGVTLATALTSELKNCPVRRDIAMTGEITLRGTVLPIGGLREKTMAAYKAGVKTVLIPYDNEKDLEDIDPVVRENIEFVCCRKIDDVLERALINLNQ